MFERLKNLLLLLFFSSLIDITVACSPTCAACLNETCVTCDVGSYMELGSCHPCPERCSSCNNTVVCNSCFQGYFGLSCERNCSIMCLNNACYKYSETCLHGCIEGYFPSGSSCYPCSDSCKTCANFSNNCLECKDGYYGSSCQFPCSHCKAGICTKDNCTYDCADGFFRGDEVCNPCKEHCASCSLYNKCQVCVNGYFGPACQFECSDCSPCNQDGSCPKMRTLAPVIILIPSLPSTSQYSRAVTSTANRPQPLTTTDANIDGGGYQQKQPMDNTIIYAVCAGVGGFFVIVLIVFVVCMTKRQSGIKQTNMRLNCRKIERDGASQDYTTLAMKSREDDGHFYSGLDNPENTVTMATMSTTTNPSGLETHHVYPQRQMGDIGRGIYINVI